ncbi:receptor-transporting protein 4 isoform X2 [Callorhinus ursinus]|uniref:Receptor-transporting protein 4 isoform X3 n=1 Tax=Callorhinus ursinus TaxID=34884 RepID=A0A3Q7PFP9_CALUR|nr:receptor-transporting protein 4 isoform X3 [Callorhinus ursinus]
MASQPQGGKTVLDVQTWEQTFQELMQQEKPRARWTLKLDEKLEPDCLAAGWMQYQQKGFGSFASLKYDDARQTAMCIQWNLIFLITGSIDQSVYKGLMQASIHLLWTMVDILWVQNLRPGEVGRNCLCLQS